MKTRNGGMRFVSILAGILAVIGMLVVFSLDPFGPRDSAQVPRAQPAAPAEGNEGTEVSLSTAESVIPFEILRPDDPLANDDTITGIWIGSVPGDSSIPSMPQVLYSVTIEYESGVRVWLGTSEILDPLEAAQARDSFARSINASLGSDAVQLTTIRGHPAIVMGAAPNVSNSYPVVEFYADGITVRVTWVNPDTFLVRAAEPLMRVADSMHS